MSDADVSWGDFLRGWGHLRTESHMHRSADLLGHPNLPRLRDLPGECDVRYGHVRAEPDLWGGTTDMQWRADVFWDADVRRDDHLRGHEYLRSRGNVCGNTDMRGVHDVHWGCPVCLLLSASGRHERKRSCECRRSDNVD